jgi:hypothetical protein
MYPRTDIDPDAELPAAAEFWTPEPDDINEEGFGYFRDVWPIVGVPPEEAHEMVRKDRAASSLANQLASTEVEFDAVAKVIETGEPDYTADLGEAKRVALSPYIAEDEDDDVPLDGLEVGVAGLVYALSAAGAYPAASCRGHHQGHSWSDLPVVLLAIDLCRAKLLEPLVKDTGCGFEIDPARTELLVVCSPSIEGTLALAEAVIGKLPEFRACDESLHLPPDPAIQPSLFEEDA